MSFTSLARAVARASLAAALLGASATAQEIPPSGVSGLDLFYATSPSGLTSQMFAVAPQFSPAVVPIGSSVAGQPSRWAHRRRTLGGLETPLTLVDPLVIATPLGDAVGNGALHVIDARTVPAAELLVPHGNPSGYDLAVCSTLKFLFVASDNGVGGTTLAGFSYGTAGQLVGLVPPALQLPGAPAAYVNRIGVDEASLTLHVPTADAVHVVKLAAGGTQMTLMSSIALAPFAPCSNPATFEVGGVRHWIAGTLRYPTGASDVQEGGWVAWTAAGLVGQASFGVVPSVPSKLWVPAAGASEVAVVSNGTDAYAYLLLREPKPSTFFVKGAAVGAVKFATGSAPTTGIIPCSDACGEPFSIPTTSGFRVAFETSFGPPFVFDPADGGERINLIYSPLDPLGAATPFGQLVVPGPLGGRISTKGMDRPLWSRDGLRTIGATSHFPGAPNPGMPGIEVLDVPTNIPVTPFQSPDVVVTNEVFPNQSIVFPSDFRPRVPALVPFLAGLSFAGNVFHDGMASVCLSAFGEIGQKQLEANPLSIPSSVPGFRSILPPAFQDATGSLLGVPNTFGARRTSFNVLPGAGFNGVVMVAAIGDEVLQQFTGANVLAELGLQPKQPVKRYLLPNNWSTSTEFLSL